MPDPTLKPCPRCGGKAEGVSDSNDEHLVSCSKCGLSDSGTWPTEQEAAAWGTERTAEQPEAEPTRNAEHRRRFIQILAEFIAGDVVNKSILLDLGNPLAREWAQVRGASPVFGYSSVDAAEATLTRFLTPEAHNA